MRRYTNRSFFYDIFLASMLSLCIVSCAKAESDDPIVFATRTGRKYHLESCPSLARSKEALQLSRAIERGLEPCMICEPPGSASLPAISDAAGLYQVNIVGLRRTEDADVRRMLRSETISVVDGDTLHVRIPLPRPAGIAEREKIRLLGVDTPETVHPSKPVEYFGKEASGFAKEQLSGKTVFLAFDWDVRDRYGRLLAYVWIGDTLVNEAIVRSGHAVPFTVPPNVRHAERFRTAAREAREAGVDPRDAPTGKADLPAVDPTAPTDPESAIAAAEAAAHAGEHATVCGLVADSRWLGPGRLTFLNLGRPYPDQDFTVVIRDGDRTAFPVPPERAYREREICVTGRIEIYRGAPQIVVRRPEAIAVLD
jgi:endonuclease YncB( thermonuclease family)